MYCKFGNSKSQKIFCEGYINTYNRIFFVSGKIDYILQQRFAIAKLLRKNDECLQFPPV